MKIPRRYVKPEKTKTTYPCCAHCGPVPDITHQHEEPCVLCYYDGEVYDR